MGLDVGTILSAATLLLLALNFAFGRTDKGAGKIDALEEKQHQHELAMKDLEARLRDHIGGGYATKADIAGLRDEIAGFRAIFEPIAQQLGPHAVRRER